MLKPILPLDFSLYKLILVLIIQLELGFLLLAAQSILTDTETFSSSSLSSSYG